MFVPYSALMWKSRIECMKPLISHSRMGWFTMASLLFLSSSKNSLRGNELKISFRTMRFSIRIVGAVP